MWFDFNGNVPGEVTRGELLRLLEVAKEVEVPIYVVFPRHQSRLMLKRKLTSKSYLEGPTSFLWYSDRDGLSKRIGKDSNATIFTNYFYAYVYWQKVDQGLVET